MILPGWPAMLLLALAAGAASGWTARGWRADASEAARLELQREAQVMQARAADAAAARHEDERERIAAQSQAMAEEVSRVVERPVYRDRCVDADGLRLIRRAVTGADGAGEPAPAMPRPDGAR